MKCKDLFFSVFLVKLTPYFPLIPAAEVLTHLYMHEINYFVFFILAHINLHTATLFKDCDN